MAIVMFCLLLVLLVCDGSEGRQLRQHTADAAVQPAVLHQRQQAESPQIRVMTSKHFKARGGAYAALGRQALVRLKRASRFVGSVEKLATHLEHEKDLGVDVVNTALLYQCRGLTANASATDLAAGTTAPSAADPTDLTAAQAFSLSSRPGATRKILLDFDGHTTVSTQWNSLVGRDSIVTAPYDKDGSPTTWSADELRDVYAIWRAVAEDFATFDVDVTTVDPGSAALAGTGIRVAIGGSYADWYGNPAGGVAYVGSFGLADLPCFVFTQNLGPNYAKYVWEAVSHEVGHTLGLFHDGVAGGSAYYSGQGDWAPIMGTGYYKTVTQFDKGEYAGSNNQQDDLAVIGTFLPLLPQAGGTSMATATPLNASVVDAATGVATGKAVGVVSSAGGNWFSFQAAAGTATLSAAVAAPWSGSTNRANLDIQLVVYDANAAVVVSINPPGADAINGLGVPATAVTLPAGGTYFIAVMGAGAGDPASTGYSNYDSRGQFELSAAYTPCSDCNGTAVAVKGPSQGAASPSPSPSPSMPPSPSPSPDPVTLRVTAISVAKVPAASGLAYCAVTLYVKSASGAAVAGVSVNGAWSTMPAMALYATNTASVFSSSAGTVSFRSAAIATGKGYTCVFNVGGVSMPGYQFDAATSVLTKRLAV